MGNNVADSEQCESTISFIKEMCGENVSSVYSTHCISKVILYLRSDDDDHISEESRWTDLNLPECTSYKYRLQKMKKDISQSSLMSYIPCLFPKYEGD